MKECLNTLKEIRKKNGYTCEDVAKLLNISKCYYWQIENKKRRLTYKMALKISLIFKTKPDNIFYNDLKENTNN